MTYPARNPAADLRAGLPPWQVQPFLTGVCRCGRVARTVDDDGQPRHPECAGAQLAVVPEPAPAVHDVPASLLDEAEAEAAVIEARIPAWAWAIYDRAG